MKKIFITGSTGFVGSEIVKLLIKENYKIFALVRNKNKLPNANNLIAIEGNILEPYTYEDILKECDILINLVGIIREFPKKGVTFQNLHIKAVANLINITKNSNITKIIHMSANGAQENAVTNYHKTKFQGQQLVVNSGITYTIFQPSVIYGPNDEFINMLSKVMSKTPIFSYFGNGKQLLQPTSVEEVAEIFVKSIKNQKTDNQIFTVCGNKILTYKEILQLILKIKNSKKLLIPVPIFLVKIAIRLFGKLDSFPLTKDQFHMLLEGNICNNRQIFKILNIRDINIEEKLREYL